MALAGSVSDGALRVGDPVRLRIRALASSGAGVGDLPDGRVAFVHRTAPGDLVEASVTRLKKRWGQAELLRVLEPGSGRRVAPCPFYERCGGCTLQHLADAEQVAWKARFVADALERIGGLEVDPPPVTPAPSSFHYRNRITLTIRKVAAGKVVAGFHALDRPDHVVELDHRCLLPEAAIGEVWRRLREAWDAGLRPLPTARELRLTLRAAEDGGVSVVVKGGAEGWDPGPLLEAVPGIVGVWHQPSGSLDAGQVAGEPLRERWGPEEVPVGGHAFLQVNREAAGPLVEHVLAVAGEGTRAVDAYCGVGVYGRTLARRGWRVTGIELDPEACRAARHGAPDGFDVVEGRVEERLPAALPADLVILNPPRTGLQEWIPGILLHHRPARIVYVSCDPATLARDAAQLREGYQTASLRAFDLFPQTQHVETVAVFHRRSGSPRRN